MPKPYVFFDVDDTLVEWTTSWRQVFAQVAREAGAEVTEEQAWEALNFAFTKLYPEFVRTHAPRGDLDEFWVAYDAEILALLGVKEDRRRWAERVIALVQQPGCIRLYPEVSEVLETLAAMGARLGIVSGRPAAAPDLELLGVRRYFDPVIDAFAAASAKSEGAMFRLAAEAAARSGRVAWHVGDYYEDDVEGARAAGLRPVLVDRRNEHPHADCPRLPDLRGLPDIIMDQHAEAEE
jgi:putative hydrolase of the HAD superfamily